MKQQYITVTEFKAKCLALLTEIDEHGGSITVTKRGRPVAKISPAAKPKKLDYMENAWKGLVEIKDDMTPLDWGDFPRTFESLNKRKRKAG